MIVLMINTAHTFFPVWLGCHCTEGVFANLTGGFSRRRGLRGSRCKTALFFPGVGYTRSLLPEAGAKDKCFISKDRLIGCLSMGTSVSLLLAVKTHPLLQ